MIQYRQTRGEKDYIPLPSHTNNPIIALIWDPSTQSWPGFGRIHVTFVVTPSWSCRQQRSSSCATMDSWCHSVMQAMQDPTTNGRSNLPVPLTIKKPGPASDNSRISLTGPALQTADLTVPGTDPRQSIMRSQNGLNQLLQSTSKSNSGKAPLMRSKRRWAPMTSFRGNKLMHSTRSLTSPTHHRGSSHIYMWIYDILRPYPLVYRRIVTHHRIVTCHHIVTLVTCFALTHIDIQRSSWIPQASSKLYRA